MKKQFLSLLALFLWMATFGGSCAAGRFILYGFLEDASMVVRNSTPFTVLVNVGGDPNDYMIPSGEKFTIPRMYPLSAQAEAKIPVNATVRPMNIAIEDGGTTWNFSHYGHYLGLYGGTRTTGKYVHATIQLRDPTLRTKINGLKFKVQQ